MKNSRSNARRVILTGATGFIGRACVGPLLRHGYEVHTLLSGRRIPSPGVIAHQADLLDREAVFAACAKIAASHLLHCAWDVSHGRYWTSPSNLRWLEASVTLLEAFAASGGIRAVGVGTCAEYGWISHRRPSLLFPPSTPYGAAKLALCHAFSAATAHKLSTAWARIFYPYGIGDKPERLIGSLISSLRARRPFACSDGMQRRDLIYIDDVGAALAMLLDGNVVGAIDIGRGRGVQLRSLIRSIALRMQRLDLVQFGALPRSDAEPLVLIADASRLRDEVGFVPSVNLDEGLRRLLL